MLADENECICALSIKFLAQMYAYFLVMNSKRCSKVTISDDGNVELIIAFYSSFRYIQHLYPCFRRFLCSCDTFSFLLVWRFTAAFISNAKLTVDFCVNLYPQYEQLRKRKGTISYRPQGTVSDGSLSEMLCCKLYILKAICYKIRKVRECTSKQATY